MSDLTSIVTLTNRKPRFTHLPQRPIQVRAAAVGTGEGSTVSVDMQLTH